MFWDRKFLITGKLPCSYTVLPSSNRSSQVGSLWFHGGALRYVVSKISLFDALCKELL